MTICARVSRRETEQALDEEKDSHLEIAFSRDFLVIGVCVSLIVVHYQAHSVLGVRAGFHQAKQIDRQELARLHRGGAIDQARQRQLFSARMRSVAVAFQKLNALDRR